ncbi:hypothetical protein FH141_08135 [Staphylococcus hominis]|uniref:hypothetical protein n=1 Tax=Staphylococcus hominis TaxID=1290 RepID=UPI001F589F36|nr:hypothetical protein [Staphylococcus hominis]MCI2919070.1 hypothetical protein [Staphylococcus hominis]MDS3927140.1 hypothetical protein [Staphylococcus hominis]
MAEVTMTLEEYHNLFKGLNTLIEKLYEIAKKGNDYKRQRDELINDMAEAKRKAEAFDEIAVTVLSEDNDVIKNMNNIVTKIVINNLERGSDE